MDNSEQVLIKLESLLGPSPELFDLIQHTSPDKNKTPYQILLHIFNTPHMEVAKYYASLTPACRRSFLFATGLNSDYRMCPKESKWFFEIIHLLPRELYPTTKEEILETLTMYRCWHWEVADFVKQVLLYKSYSEACAAILKYNAKLNSITGRLGLTDKDITPLLDRSFRNIYETMDRLRDYVVAKVARSFKYKEWKPLLRHGAADVGERHGHLSFSEIYTIDKAIQIVDDFNNCLMARIADGFGGESRFFIARRKGIIVGFLQIDLTVVVTADFRIIQWRECDFVDTKNETIEHKSWLKNMKAFLEKRNEEINEPSGLKDYIRTSASDRHRDRRLCFSAAMMVDVPALAKTTWDHYIKTGVIE